MIWQIAAATVVGSLFYVRKVVMWLRNHLGLKSSRLMGYLFATVFAAVTSPVVCSLFQQKPLPRFNDVFLVGIVLTCYLFTWDSAAYLLVLSLMVSAWVLPPYGTLAVSDGADWYRMISFAALSVFIICLLSRLKERREATESSPAHMMIRSMVAGD